MLVRGNFDDSEDEGEEMDEFAEPIIGGKSFEPADASFEESVKLRYVSNGKERSSAPSRENKSSMQTIKKPTYHLRERIENN